MAIRFIIDSGPPITREDIHAFERRLNAKFPGTYKRFLLQHNGGRPEPPYFKREVLSRFYSLNAGKATCDLLAHYKLLRKDLPTGLIPIAGDKFGNQICLALTGRERGKLYFWDHEGASEYVDMAVKYPQIVFNEGDDEPSPPASWPGYPDLTLIADSFAEFLDSFHEPDLDEPKVKRKRPK